jgi:hypothetical protein
MFWAVIVEGLVWLRTLLLSLLSYCVYCGTAEAWHWHGTGEFNDML